MHKIPVEGVGGLIFALGIASVFLLGVPAFAPLVGASVVGGALAALALHRFRPAGLANVRGGVPAFVVGLALFLSLGNAGFRLLVCLAVAGGIAAAGFLHRAHATTAHPSLRPSSGR